MKPILYRPGSKRSLVVAFAAAAAIHVSALAFSPSHREKVLGLTGPSEVILEQDPPDPEPSPPPEQMQVPEATAPAPQSNDFDEPPQPTPRLIARMARPIRPNVASTVPKLSIGNGKVYAVSAPRPNYPYEARAHHVTGSGMVLLQIDSKSGAVLNATLTQSTGSPLLDNAAMLAFHRWRFRSDTPSEVRIPFTFTMFGAQL